MNKLTDYKTPIYWQDLITAESQVAKVFAIAEKYHWDNVKKFCEGDPISKPIIQQGWILKPRDMYEGIIPEEGTKRLNQLQSEGVHILAVFVADDAHSLDPEPPPQEPKPDYLTYTLKALGTILLGIGAAVVGAAFIAAAVVVALVVSVVVVILGAILTTITTAGGIGLLLLYDPCLIICVLDEHGDCVWVSVYEWWD